MHQSDLIVVKRAPGKGRGIFARKVIPEGELIETAPMLIFPVHALVDGFANAHLRRYFFYWGKDKFAIALGYGSLYNHSFTPNAQHEQGYASLTFRAIRQIEKGEEITINYHGEPRDYESVDFEVVEKSEPRTKRPK